MTYPTCRLAAWLGLLLGALACGGGVDSIDYRSAAQGGSTSEPPALAPPEDAVHLCGGHVSGAPSADGSPGPHIVWTAYHSPQAPAALARAYRESLGTAAHSLDEGGCDTWRFPREEPDRILQVCPVVAAGPWSGCSAAPPEAASIVLISSRARVDPQEVSG